MDTTDDLSSHKTLLVGSYAASAEPGIYLFKFDTKRGNINLEQAIIGNENPSYLCISNDGKLVYAINEQKKGDEGKISVYQLTNEKRLTELSQVSYAGAGSCFISVDRSLQHVFIANYGSGSLTLMPLINGLPGEVTKLLSFQGHSVNPERQEQPHIHTAVLSVDERRLFCSDLGTDRIYIFDYQPQHEVPVLPAKLPYLTVPPGSGPRHIVCSKNEKWLYVICELSGHIFAFSQNGDQSNWFQKIPLAPEDFSGEVEASDLQIHPNGKFLYAAARGDLNQLIVFEIDETTGQLSMLQSVPAEGKSPRNLVIDPSGNFLLAANEQSDSITVFSISTNDGKITFTGQSVHLKKPTCLKFA